MFSGQPVKSFPVEFDKKDSTVIVKIPFLPNAGSVVVSVKKEKHVSSFALHNK